MDNGAGRNWKLGPTGQLGSEESPVQTGATRATEHRVMTTLLLNMRGGDGVN